MTPQRTRPILRSELGELPDGCASCPLEGRPIDPDAAWVQAALKRFGLVGLGAVVDDELVGYVLLAPASHVPRVNPLYGRAAPESAVLLRAHVAVADPRHAVARHLISAAAARLRSAPAVGAIEATGAVSRPTCVTPAVAWLAATGFAPMGEGTRMRLDLSRTLVWRQGLSVAKRLARLAPTPPLAPPEPTARR